MAVNLSPVFGAGAQLFNNDGVPLSGGKIYTYLAGTSTPTATYTSSLGAIAHANPIVLDAAGRVPGGEIWLTDGIAYKFVVKDVNDVLIGTYDNLSGINSNFVSFVSETEIQTATAGQTVFTLTTIEYQPGTNNLLVFVDGVNQYQGSSYSFVETNSTTVTFDSGLHVGALVKFTTATPLNSGTTDAASVSYNEGGTGAVSTTVEAKLQEFVSVKDFGAVGDGVTDDTVAIQNAIDEVGDNGSGSAKGVIYFPAGEYKCGGIVINSYNNIIFQGSGMYVTKFVARSLTETIFTVDTVGSIYFKDIGFTANNPMTAGSFVEFNNSNSCGMTNFAMNNGYDCIVMNDCAIMWFNIGQIRDFKHNGVTIDGGNDHFFDQIIMDMADDSYAPNSGFYTEQHGGSLVITNSDILHTHNGLWANPGASQFVNWIYMSNVFFDTMDFSTDLRGGIGIKVTPHGGGVFNGGSWSNVWTATGDYGMQLVGDATSQLSGLQISNYRCVNNYKHGVVTNYCSKVSFENVAIAGNSQQSTNVYSGFIVGTNVDHITIIGGYIGEAESYPATQKYAIDFGAGFAGIIVVQGVMLDGNVSGSIYTSGVTPFYGSNVSACPGFNPLGPALVTPGSSPYVYTAGFTSENVNIYSGTGVTVTVNGVAIANQSPCSFTLAPTQVATITYLTTPTIAINKA